MALLGLSALGAFLGVPIKTYCLLLVATFGMPDLQDMGLLLSSAGGGALVGAFGLASFKRLKNQGAVMLVNGFLFSVSLMAFAISPS